jgi:hypothetical protein
LADLAASLNAAAAAARRYQSGARYEGEWRNNLKDGRGVYYFPKVSSKLQAMPCLSSVQRFDNNLKDNR